jgi:inward rectifier potassium channel
MPPPPLPPNIVLVGQKRAFFRDLYHEFLQRSILQAIGLILAGIVVINTVFACLYLAFGGVANAQPGSFLDAFSFSIQTLVTIGYGSMYPESVAAKVLSDVEALTGLVVTAVATGLLFTKFTQTRATVYFTKKVVITPFEGVPTLMFRVGNERGNLIVDAQARLVLNRTEKTAEGHTFYRMYDLALVRDHSISFTRSWTVMHTITPTSPLYGMGPAELKAQEVEIACSVVGIDDTSLQPVHGRVEWEDTDILFGYRLADLIRHLPDGRLEADARRFDEVVLDGTAASEPKLESAGSQ